MSGPRDYILLASAVSALMCSGCVREPARRRGPSLDVAWSKPQWGPQSHGLQCRLRPAKRLWRAGQRPTFTVDLRNHGKRIFAFRSAGQISVHEFTVDGRRHRLADPPAAQFRIWPLAPGVEFLDLAVCLPEEVPVSSGRHEVQVSFLLEGIEVVSNAAGIEILASR